MVLAKKSIKSLIQTLGVILVTAQIILSIPNGLANTESESVEIPIILFYETLLQEYVHQPLTPNESFFHQPLILTAFDIELATQELTNILRHRSFPHLMNRIFTLWKIKRNLDLTELEKKPLLIELNQIQLSIQDEIQRMEKRKTTSNLTSYGFASIVASGVMTITPFFLSQDGPNTHHFRLASWSLGGLGFLNLVRTFIQGHTWKSEDYSDSRDWEAQLNEWGPSIDQNLHRLFHMHLDQDSEIFPAIPYYTILLNHAAVQMQHDRTTPQPIASNLPPDSISIPMGYNPEATRDHAFSELLEPTYTSAIQQICDSIQSQPYSLKNQLKLRRLFFLSLKKKNIEALYTLMNTPLKNLLFYPRSPLQTPFKKTFLLAIEKNSIELVKVFTEAHPNLPRLPTFLTEHPSTLETGRHIAQRRGHLEVLGLLSAFSDRIEAARPMTARLRQTASHDRDTEATHQDSVAKLRARYRQRLRQTFPRGEHSVFTLVEGKVDYLVSRERLTPLQATTVKGLLARINEPFDPRELEYDPHHLFKWNTQAKKKNTEKMLQLSYLALEDPQSFQELTHTPIQPQDLEDRWTSWIVNALYDGGGAYALDQGNHPELASLRAVNSCVAGVDHRMIHGLTGLHPDVKISTGSSEQSNLLTWRLAQTRFKEQQKASFYNAVFTTLLSEWTQETIQRSHTAEDSNSTVYVNPLAQTRLVKEYQKFVTQRAETLFGAELIASDEFKTLLETIEEYPEKIFQALQEAANRSPATNESTS